MLVSIIVPVYNAILYLHKCLDSILNQKYERIEIILVDDGSDDGSEKVCDRYRDKDDRVRVTHKTHGGLVSARKEGIKQAVGDYVCWVDADDWVEKDYIFNLVQLWKKSKADVVAAAHYHDIHNDSAIVRNGIPNGLYDVSQIISLLLYTGNFYEYGITPHLVTKMFRTELMKQSECSVNENIVAGEDAAATYPVLIRCKKILISDMVGYHYVQHVNSMTKTTNSNEEERIELLIMHLKEQFIEKGVYEELKDQLFVYTNYLKILRKIELFDIDANGKILMPYGGSCRQDRIIIYGAGVLGQMIYKYVTADNKLEVVAWVDKNFSSYRNDGYAVMPPDILKKIDNNYDAIIIANISEKAAVEIRKKLLSYHIPDEKIRWLTEDVYKARQVSKVM